MIVLVRPKALHLFNGQWADASWGKTQPATVWVISCECLPSHASECCSTFQCWLSDPALNGTLTEYLLHVHCSAKFCSASSVCPDLSVDYSMQLFTWLFCMTCTTACFIWLILFCKFAPKHLKMHICVYMENWTKWAVRKLLVWLQTLAFGFRQNRKGLNMVISH